MNGAPLALRDVVVRYAGVDRNAVDHVSLDVAAGELVVFLGPSGCGKSTLLRTINRLVVPDAGTIAIDGRDVATLPPAELRRGIGYAIQAVGLFPHYTVAQNVGIVPGLLKWERERIRARVDELLALVHLDPARYRDRLPRELSGGEQQRVGVARAIAAEPRVLLMDEPFGAVDAIVRTSLQDETRRIHEALGTTILFVTHDVDEALRLADRIVVMREGRVEQADAPLALLSAPATPYVEELLDTRDAVRRLGLLFVRDAVAETGRDGRGRDGAGDVSFAPTQAVAPLAADATLRDALARLLSVDAERVPVVGGGTVGLAEIRRALTDARNRAT